MVIADSTALIEARRFVREAGIPQSMSMAAQLLVSELVFSFLRHAPGATFEIEIAVRTADDRVRVDVARHGVGHLIIVDDSLLEEAGLGLDVMNTLAHRWGIQLDRDVWRGWFELRDDPVTGADAPLTRPAAQGRRRGPGPMTR